MDAKPRARRSLKRAVEGCRIALDRNHDTTEAALAILSAVYSQRRDMKKLESVLLEAVQIALFRHGKDDEATAGANRGAGLFLLVAERLCQGRALHPGLPGLVHQEKAGDWDRLAIDSKLGLSLLGQKKYVEAKQLLLSAYSGMKAREKTISAGRGPTSRTSFGGPPSFTTRMAQAAMTRTSRGSGPTPSFRPSCSTSNSPPTRSCRMGNESPGDDLSALDLRFTTDLLVRP